MIHKELLPRDACINKDIIGTSVIDLIKDLISVVAMALHELVELSEVPHSRLKALKPTCG